MDWGDTISTGLDWAGKLAPVATSAYGIWEGLNSSAAAGASSKEANKTLQLQRELANKQWDWSQEQWDRYLDLYDDLEREQIEQELSNMEMYQPLQQKMVDESMRQIDMYAPLEDKFVEEAKEGIDENELKGRVSADVSHAFDKNFGIAKRNMAADTGINSGAVKEMTRQFGIQRALAEAGGRTNAHTKAKEMNQNLLTNALNVRRGFMATPQNSTPTGSSLISSSINSAGSAGQNAGFAAGGFGDMAQMHYGNKANAMNTAGAGLGFLAGRLENQKTRDWLDSL